MIVHFLGTGASPSMPVPFCHCQVCTNAQLVRGKNLRRRSSIKINDDMLVDIGPDIVSSAYDHNITLLNISICLQTHFHEDHFDPEMIISRHSDYGAIIENELLLVGSKRTLEVMDAIICRRCGYGSIFEKRVQSDFRIKLKEITTFKSYTLGNYQITGYPANHGSQQDECLLYSIEYYDKCLFYGTDTSILSEEVWNHLNETDKKYDLVILDHTYGIGYESKRGDHLASKDFIGHVDRICNMELLKSKGIIYATHISHEGILEHNELDNYAMEHNYRIAYDGLLLNL